MECSVILCEKPQSFTRVERSMVIVWQENDGWQYRQYQRIPRYGVALVEGHTPHSLSLAEVLGLVLRSHAAKVVMTHQAYYDHFKTAFDTPILPHRVMTNAVKDIPL